MATKFINCTNHPSTSWSQAQIDAAHDLGDEIIDIDFPNVPPTATYEEVEDLVKELRKKIFEAAGEDEAVVLLQGETTVLSILAETSGYNRSYDLNVNYVAGRHLQCVTACSERRCCENPDGTRTYKFEFVQFRKSFELY
ncbi:MAG: hypothetical protein J6Y02_09910 [Pseudobutyrivibrio sp.]|nr:hypothetical protein [Pseudobutyrivibrio sp.]